MALIVEDGSGVAGANTLISRTELISFAALRGITIPDTDASDALLIKAMDYLELRPWRGTQVYEDGLFWPRSGIVTEAGEEVADDFVPGNLKKAQAQLALAVFSGIDLLPTRKGGPQMIRRKTGPLETEWAQPGMTPDRVYAPLLSSVDALLSAYLENVGGLSLRVYKG